MKISFFLSVALEYADEEIAKWKRFVSGENIYPNIEFLNDLDLNRGTHLVADRQFKNEALKPYMINYAPTYVLIDKDFTIASPRAPRPSVAYEEIAKLLKE